MISNPFPRSRYVTGYDEPPADARVRNLLALALITPQPDIDGRVADGTVTPWLAEFDFNPASHDPIAQWQAVTTVEVCPGCQRDVEAGEHVAVTARGRRLCADCGVNAQ